VCLRYLQQGGPFSRAYKGLENVANLKSLWVTLTEPNYFHEIITNRSHPVCARCLPLTPQLDVFPFPTERVQYKLLFLLPIRSMCVKLGLSCRGEKTQTAGV
jgi:hypothetical protein